MQITLEKFCNMRYNNLTKERWSMWFFKKKNKKVEEKEVEEKNEEAVVETKQEAEVKEEAKTSSNSSKTKNSNTKSNKNEEKIAKKETSKKEEKTETSEEEKKGSYRVLYSKEDKVWLIKRDGAKRTIASYKTKEQALARVSELCKNQNAKVIVHKKDGKFQKQTKKI